MTAGEVRIGQGIRILGEPWRRVPGVDETLRNWVRFAPDAGNGFVEMPESAAVDVEPASPAEIASATLESLLPQAVALVQSAPMPAAEFRRRLWGLPGVSRDGARRLYTRLTEGASPTLAVHEERARCKHDKVIGLPGAVAEFRRWIRDGAMGTACDAFARLEYS